MTNVGFLGRGWSFPVAVATEGDVAMVTDEEDVRESILLILRTEPGERVMRPDFGSGLRGLLFEPTSTRLTALIEYRVRHALTTWEPRIDVETVSVSDDRGRPGELRIEIRYRIRATNTFYNLVYPFYLARGTT